MHDVNFKKTKKINGQKKREKFKRNNAVKCI